MGYATSFGRIARCLVALTAGGACAQAWDPSRPWSDAGVSSAGSTGQGSDGAMGEGASGTGGQESSATGPHCGTLDAPTSASSCSTCDPAAKATGCRANGCFDEEWCDHRTATCVAAPVLAACPPDAEVDVPTTCAAARGSVGCCGPNASAYYCDVHGTSVNHHICLRGACVWNVKRQYYDCDDGDADDADSVAVDPTGRYPRACGGGP